MTLFAVSYPVAYIVIGLRRPARRRAEHIADAIAVHFSETPSVYEVASLDLAWELTAYQAVTPSGEWEAVTRREAEALVRVRVLEGEA